MKNICILLSLLLSACGYHLVGQGDGAGVIPADAQQVVIVGGDNESLKSVFTQTFKQSMDLPVVHASEADAHTAEIHLENISEQLNATAFDASGIANQYQLTISAGLRVLQGGKELWSMPSMAVSADVFATGGSAEIEAQKVSVAKSLREEWARKAMARLRSGF